MLRSFPSVSRWERTDDILQNALIRLHKSLAKVKPESPRMFYGLAATQIRRELIDLARRFSGAHGIGHNHDTNNGESVQRSTDTNYEPESLERWTEFHKEVEGLPEEQRAVVEILWYGGISQKQAAKLLHISLSTVKRRWQAARLQLSEQLKSQWIG